MPRIARFAPSTLVFLLLAGFSSASSSANWTRLKAPGEKMTFNGYSVHAPAEQGWLYQNGGAFDVGFGALISRTQSWGLTALALPAAARFEKSEALAAFASARLLEDNDPQRFRIIESKSAPERMQDALCARTYHKAEDHQALNRRGPYSIVEVTNLTCVHPSSPDLVVELGYHERYMPGEKSGGVIDFGERFLSSLRFSQAKPDPAMKLRFATDLLERQERPVSPEPLIRDAIELFQKGNDAAGLADAYGAYATFFRSEARYANSMEYFDKAASLYAEQKRYDKLAGLNLDKAFTYVRMKEIGAACDAFNRSLEAAEDVVRANPAARPAVPAGYTSFSQYMAETKKRYTCP
jgi:tetratricopeptide (TPR) repeat protein